MPLGRFLDNALTLAGRGLRGINEADLADACDAYMKWREEFASRFPNKVHEDHLEEDQ